jgi:hypothetical protein
MTQRPTRAILALALIAPLAGCSSWFTRKEPPPCPTGAIVKDAARKVVYRPGPGRDITDVVFEATLARISIGCKYDDTGVAVDTAVTIIGARGPADTTRRAEVRYFAAVLDPGNAILGKREFQTTLQFPLNVDRGATTEELVQRIPVGKNVSAGNFTIVVGFQLTREELEANRQARGGSLVAPSGVRPAAPDYTMPEQEQSPRELIKRPNL